MPQTQIPRPFLVRTQPAASPIAASEKFDTRLIVALATITSIAALIAYYFRGEILLYGDAFGHINIARRVFDSRTPGPAQLGTVWLPLPHLAMLPFLLSNWMWRTGVGGSIPSMVAYVASTAGLYRFVRRGLAWSPHQTAARAAAWLAVIIFAANPSIIYLQATPMTEVPYLAFFIWAAAFFSEFVQQGRSRSLTRCAVMLFCCTLTRYDGWFALGLFGMAALAVVIYHRSPWKVFAKAALIAALGPLLWLGWNAYFYNNPLEFANGPYSAKAIAERTTRPGEPHYPGWHSPSMAARQLIKSTRLTLAGDDLRRQDIWPYPKWYRLENVWFPVAAMGTLLLVGSAPWMWPWLLLWTPLPFYALSIAYGSVPIFLPSWWPYSYYNVRYGTQLLPSVALFVASAAFLISTKIARYYEAQRYQAQQSTTLSQSTEGAPCLPDFGKRGSFDFARSGASAFVWLALSTLVFASYVGIWRHTPAALREPQMNSAARISFERQLAAELKKLPPGSTVLMYTAERVGSLEQIAMPLRRTINEGNYLLWNAALANPAQYAQYAVATDNDPVAQSINQHRAQFELVARVEHDGQKPAAIYRAVAPAK
jgi:hypothetical protein